MSIANAINNARNKINNAYNALENKGAQIPDVKDLQHLPDAINSVSEFSREFANWKYSGSQGYLYLNGTYVSPGHQCINVPYTNYTYLTNTTFTSGTADSSTHLKGVNCGDVPFVSAIGAFTGLTNLCYVENAFLPEGNYFPPAINNTTYNTNSAVNTFRGCSNLQYVSIKLGEAYNASNMFRGCTNCEYIVLNAPNIYNMRNTFNGLDYGKGIVISSPNVNDITNAFSGSLSKLVYIPFTYSTNYETSTYMYFNYYETTGSVQLADLNQSPLVFEDDFQIRNVRSETSSIRVTIPYKNSYSVIKEIANYRAYPDSTSYTTFNVTSMSNTFSNCTNLNQNIQIPDSVTSMSSTFSNCYNLNQNIQIPSSVTEMSHTFRNCYNLNQNIQIPNSVTNMYGTFYACISLNQNIQIPNSVKNISDIFYYCNNLNQPIQIGSSVVNMNNSFNYCTQLSSSISIYSDQVVDSNRCFYGTSRAKNVHIPYTYSNGEYTKTFNSFVEAGYLYANGVSNNQHGVTMHDLNEQ